MKDPTISPLFQREVELKALEDAQRKSMTGKLQVVLVEGDAGSGKTSLLLTFANKLAHSGKDCPVVAIGRSGNNYDNSDPYRLINRILRNLVHENAQQDKHFLKRLAHSFVNNAPSWLEAIPIGGQIASAFTQTIQDVRSQINAPSLISLEQQLEALLEQISKDTGMVIIADDAHWADKSSINLLMNLTEDLADVRILLVLSYRNAEAKSQEKLTESNSLIQSITNLERYIDVTHLPIGGLSAESAKEILRNEGIEQVPDTIATEVAKLSEGNALFIHEIAGFILQNLDSQNGIVEVFNQFKRQGSFTDRMHKVFEARVNSLCGQKQTLLKKSAFLGYEVDPSLVVSINGNIGEDQVYNILDELHESDKLLGLGVTVTGEDCYRFTNKRLADHLNAVSRTNKISWKRTNEKIALTLERKLLEVPEAEKLRLHVKIAHHYDEAGKSEKACPHIVAAAKAAFDNQGYYEVCKLAGKLNDADFQRQPAIWDPFFKSAQWISAFPIALQKWELIKDSPHVSSHAAINIARAHRMTNQWGQCVNILNSINPDQDEQEILAQKEMLLGEVKLCGTPQRIAEAVQHYQNVESLSNVDNVLYRAVGHQGLSLLCNKENLSQAFVELNRAVKIAQDSGDQYKLYEAIHWLSKAQIAVLDVDGARASVRETTQIAKQAEVHKHNPYHFRDRFRIEVLDSNLEKSLGYALLYTEAIMRSRAWSESSSVFEMWLSMLALQVAELHALKRGNGAVKLVEMLEKAFVDGLDFSVERRKLFFALFDSIKACGDDREVIMQMKKHLGKQLAYDAEQIFAFNIPDFWERRKNAAF